MAAPAPVATKWILSVSGGGVRDVIPAGLMNEVQHWLGAPLGRVFDMLVGVSGGALLSLYANVHRDESMDFVALLNEANLSRILDKSAMDRMLGEVQLLPVYDGLGKERVLQQYLGATTVLGDLSALPTVVPIFNLRQRQLELATTHQPQYATWPVWQVAQASSAAIPYFPPVTIHEQLYVDGGFAANDPVLVAYLEARRWFGPDCNVRILSLGAGRPSTDPEWQDTHRVQSWGGIQWMLHGLLDVLMEAPNELMASEVERLLRVENASSQPNVDNRLLRINPPVPPIKLDDTSQMDQLKRLGQETWLRVRPEVQAFFQP